MTDPSPRPESLEAWFQRVVVHDEPGPGPALLRIALVPLSWIYAAVIEAYKLLFDSGILKKVRLPCHVISIGSLTLGGVGKTVATVSLARALQAAGYRCVVLSYGFRASHSSPYAVVSNDKELLLSPREAGDEAAMLAQMLPGVPVIIGKRRGVSGQAAIRLFHPDVILLDDGFQHWRLHRDIDLVLLDARRPLGNGRVFPAGILREIPGSLRRATGCILTRCSQAAESEIERSLDCLSRLAPGVPILRSDHLPGVPYPIAAPPAPGGEHPSLSGQSDPGLRGPVVIVSGIARNEAFLETARGAGVAIAAVCEFPDHHSYSPDDVQGILRQAKGCAAVLTTEKDAVKLAPHWPASIPLWVIPVRLAGISDVRWLDLCRLPPPASRPPGA